MSHRIAGPAWILSLLVMVAPVSAVTPSWTAEPVREVFLQTGPGLSSTVQVRLIRHLRSVVDQVALVQEERELASFPDGALVLALGDTPLTRQALSAVETQRVGPEGFMVRTHREGRVTLIAVDGNPADFARPLRHTRLKVERAGLNLGVAYGAFAVLEKLGFGFLHPLAPVVPKQLAVPAEGITMEESPYWSTRSIHLHTMHPLELTNVVNGWGKTGPWDRGSWESMLGHWDSFLDWMLANRQNMVQWVLLDDPQWADFATSSERLNRLKVLVDRAHSHGLRAGVDVPLALAQQNGFRLIRVSGSLEEEVADMRTRIDWLMQAGFDLLTTEIGFSEFHSPDDHRMVAWLDAMASILEAYQAETTVKVHVSVAEHSKVFRDPDTGEKLNINFIPHFSDPRVGVLVHTVQFYALDDPAETYGRKDFTELRRFLSLEAGSRATYWYPETAYWVSFDVDVPLFLPVYAGRRFHDLRLIASDELEGRLGRGGHVGSRMDGQVVFSSGWEWGYWLNDVVAARATWNPRMDIADERAALQALLAEALAVFGSETEALVATLLDSIDSQTDLLIHGRRDGSKVAYGQSYLQGVETWDDMADLLDRVPFVQSIRTQPDRVGPLDVRGRSESRTYERLIRPLMQEMVMAFGGHADRFEAHRTAVPDSARDLSDDLADSSRMTALRAEQLNALYDKASRYRRRESAWKDQRFARAQAILDEATALVAQRESQYRIDPELIAGWGPSPTSYTFGYLWTARSLFYWWRDEGKVAHRPRSACYLNVMNPAEVATAEGVEHDLYKRIETVVRWLGFALGWADDCLHPYTTEPDLPSIVR